MTAMKATSGTVLVVDDEDIVREVVCTYLEREGYSTLQASAGRAALALIESEQPDLVVLDVMLPEVDGYSILTELRRRADVPVILLTARTEETDRVLGLELGNVIAFAVVTETVFAWPGMGKLLIDSIVNLDRPVVVAYLLLFMR